MNMKKTIHLHQVHILTIDLNKNHNIMATVFDLFQMHTKISEQTGACVTSALLL